MRQGDVEVDGSVFLFVADPKPCFMCKQLTRLVEINFEAHLCLDCHDKAWGEVLEGMCSRLAKAIPGAKAIGPSPQFSDQVVETPKGIIECSSTGQIFLLRNRPHKHVTLGTMEDSVEALISAYAKEPA